MKLLLLLLVSSIFSCVFSFNINIINTPFDLGANMQGSSKAFRTLESDLYKSNININKINDIDTKTRHVTQIFDDVYINSWNNLNQEKISLQIGGDHSIAIPSIFAANSYCGLNQEVLGVLWIDAHADFNTIQTSITGNIHGVPVAVLCGHTLPIFAFGDYLDTNQFAYYGVRDVDSLEFDRMQEYDMSLFENVSEIKEWMNKFDKIHISFDLDCLDPKVFSSVNTPVDNGLQLDNIYEIFEEIKKNKKLLSADIVEYNPDKGKNNKVVIEIIEKMLV